MLFCPFFLCPLFSKSMILYSGISTHNISYTNGSIIEWNKSQITHVCLYGKPNYFWLINGIGIWSHSHAPAHAMLKIHIWYVTRLKHWLVSPLAHASFIFYSLFPHLLMLHLFSTLLHIFVLHPLYALYVFTQIFI